MTQSTLNLDLDPIETKEWLDALLSVLKVEGKARAEFLVQQLLDTARQRGVVFTAGVGNSLREYDSR
ncbi:hypothetical protein [Rickettsiella massiliensis]|uniref:hypothetical protein n=1 Tax=Rickettsiella massiliensis TaxID=676517 RepID=UPI00029AAFE5